MATAGTNITAIAKPAIGTTAGPQWATDLNSTIDALDGHDHSTGKGIRITPAAININAALEYNSNDATELKTISFDSAATASTTSYSVYQASGNLYWRNGSGVAVQVTTGSSVNAGAGAISGMTGTDAGASYTDGSKTFNFFTDSGNSDYGKVAHADLLLFKFSDDDTTDTDYVTLKCDTNASGAAGTIYLPGEDGTLLSTSTSYAGGNIAVTATAGQIDLSSSSTLDLVTSAANSNITLTPHGTGTVVVSKASFTTITDLGTVTTANIDGGTIDGVTIGTNSACTDLRVDNIKVDANTISSTDTNGALNYDTNGTGDHVFKVGTTTALTVSYAGGNTTITGA